jgi:hypothetical protein
MKKKKLFNATRSSVCFMSIVVILVLLASCAEEPYNPGIQPPEISTMDPDSAFPGQEVTIYGANFSTALAGNEISFNGTAATPTATTGISLVTIVPEGATTGNVTVTTNELTSEGYAFTVTEPVIPVITDLDPDIGKVGTTVIITGSNFSTEPDGNTVSFNGTEAAVTAATETTITTSVPAGATTGNVTVTVDGESNGLPFTVIESNMLVVSVTDDTDDAEEGALSGAMTSTSSDLELGEYDTWTQGGIEQGLQTIGVKFRNITIPKGATILAASIQFWADNTGSDPVQLTIYAENTADAESFTDYDLDGDPAGFYNITTRTRTVENVVWDVPPWLNTGLHGPDQATPDLAELVQVIVNRDDWVSGNSMAFIMEHSGPSIGVTSDSGGREAEAGPGDDAPTLTITYDE